MSFTCRQWLLVLPPLLLLGALPGASVELQLTDVKFTGGEIHFNTPAPQPIPSLPIAIGEEDVQAVSTPHYTVLISFDDIHLNKYGFIRYLFYVRPKPGVAGDLTSFVVKGEPIGAIPAKMTEIDFYVGEGAGKMEPGKISLPVFSPDSDYLAAGFAGSDHPHQIDIAGTTSIQIPLKNSQRWAVSIEGIHPPVRNDLWREADLLVKGSREFHGFEIQPVTVNDDSLVLRLVPNSWSALAETLLPRRSEREPELVTVSLDYTNRFGAARSLPIKVPVQFAPGLAFMILSLLGGTLVGSVIPVVAGQRPRKRWLHAFLASLLTALLVWAIACELVLHGSEFRLLGFTFDPRQLLSAALIGALLGVLGFRSLETLTKLIPALGKEAGAGEEGKS